MAGTDELLKQINREIKVTSIENSERAEKSRLKSERELEKSDELSEENEDGSESVEEDIDNNDVVKKESSDVSEEVEDIAEEQIDDISDNVEVNVLSSDPKNLLNSENPLIRNEIDDVDVVDGILNDFNQDKTSAFVDPDIPDENLSALKVVDTTLGVFTILNHDDKSVLLLDCNKQKIQISLDDFNNLHPFEIKDERLSEINDFKDAYKRDKKEEEIKEEEENNSEDNFNDESNEPNESEEEYESEEEDYENSSEEGGDEITSEDLSFGESVSYNNKVKTKKVVSNEETKKESSGNVLSEIQKNLSSKRGVKETIRSDVRSKNRCILIASKTKSIREKDRSLNETKPKQLIKKRNVHESKKQLKKEVTQPSAIYTAPKPLGVVKNDFDVKKVMTIKDGKYVFVKLEGKQKTAYLKIKSKNELLSIKNLDRELKNASSFFESLNIISDGFYILEKEVVMRKFRKYEAEEVEDLDQDVDVEEEEVDVDEDDEESEDEEVEDAEEDENDVESDEDEDDELSEAIEFSTEINGVKYSGTLYRDDSDDELDDEESEDEDSEEDEDKESESEEDDDLILQSEEELEDLDFPEGLDESVIKARAKIYGKRYNVSFCNVKQECVKRAKLEMRRHNIVEAWNMLVRGARKIKC